MGFRRTGSPPSRVRIRLPALNWRFLRIGIGVALLLAGASIYAQEILHTTSSEAIVNARIVTISAPIDGRVLTVPPHEGALVAADAPLLTIENQTVDRSRLEDLLSARDKTQSELVGMRRLRDVLDQQLESLDEQMLAYQAATVTRLETVLRESQADAESLRAAAREAQHENDRKRPLLTSGAASMPAIDHA